MWTSIMLPPSISDGYEMAHNQNDHHRPDSGGLGIEKTDTNGFAIIMKNM